MHYCLYLKRSRYDDPIRELNFGGLSTEAVAMSEYPAASTVTLLPNPQLASCRGAYGIILEAI